MLFLRVTVADSGYGMLLGVLFLLRLVENVLAYAGETKALSAGIDIKCNGADYDDALNEVLIGCGNVEENKYVVDNADKESAEHSAANAF